MYVRLEVSVDRFSPSGPMRFVVGKSIIQRRCALVSRVPFPVAPLWREGVFDEKQNQDMLRTIFGRSRLRIARSACWASKLGDRQHLPIQLWAGRQSSGDSVVAPNTLVSLPPDLAMQLEILAKVGDQATASGVAMPAQSGMQIMQPLTLSVGGRTLNLAQPSPPAPYAGSGVIRSLNYGPQGDVNGFVLQNGVIALTPPMGSSDVSVVKVGASISVSGFARGLLPLGEPSSMCKPLPRMVKPSR